MLNYRGKNKRIIQATIIANKLLNGEKGFYQIVKDTNYLNTNTSSNKIAQCIKGVYCKYEFEVKTYWKWNPFSSESAYFTPKRPLDINLNNWGARNKTVESYVNSIIHEFVHVVDNQFIHLDFTHTFHNHNKRNQSAPYQIGSIAQNLTKAYYVS